MFYLFISNLLPCHLLTLFPKQLQKALTTYTEAVTLHLVEQFPSAK